MMRWLVAVLVIGVVPQAQAQVRGKAVGNWNCMCPGRMVTIPNSVNSAAPDCRAVCFGGGGAAPSGYTALQQQQLNMAHQFGTLLGEALRRSIFGTTDLSGQQTALQREAQQREAEAARRAQEEAAQAELRRLAAEEEQRKNEIRDRLLRDLKDVGPVASLKVDTGAGLQFKLGDDALPGATLAEVPAGSAFAQLTRASYFSELAAAANAPEQARAFADAAFEGALGLPVSLPVPPGRKAVQLSDDQVLRVEGVQRGFFGASDRVAVSIGKVASAEYYRDAAARAAEEAQRRFEQAQRELGESIASARASREKAVQDARRAAERARARAAERERARAASYEEAKRAQGTLVASTATVLEVLASINRAPGAERRAAYVRGLQDASTCAGEDMPRHCGPGASGECSAGYASGYHAAARMRALEIDEARVIGERAAADGNPTLGLDHPKSLGPCRVRWMEAYYAGYNSRRSSLRPGARAYVPSGNALIGGTSWLVGYNVPPGSSQEIRERGARMLREQSELAGMPYNEAIDLLKYDFVLGVAYSTWIVEDLGTRVLADQLSAGRATPAMQNAYNSLKGRSFDTLSCHSNGAMICLAALRNKDIRAREVILYGPQVTPSSLREWADVMSAGPDAPRVRVVINRGDPVPGIAMAAGSLVAGNPARTATLWGWDGMRAAITAENPGIHVTINECRAGFPRSATEVLACHDMRIYAANSGDCRRPSSGAIVPGTASPGNTGYLEPPPPC